MRKPKTEFGVEIKEFAARTGMTLRELAEMSGVKYTTLLDTSTGRSVGRELIPAVRKFMAEYDHKNGGTHYGGRT